MKKLDVADSFCYLGGTIGAGGGCDLSVITRVRSLWGKFRELLPILTSRTLLYTTRWCLASSVNNMLKLERNDRAMVRWICNVYVL